MRFANDKFLGGIVKVSLQMAVVACIAISTPAMADKTFALVNGEKLTQEDANQFSAMNASPVGSSGKSPLDLLVDRTLLAQAAVAKGFVDSPIIQNHITGNIPFPAEKVYLPGTTSGKVLNEKEKANFLRTVSLLANLYVNVLAHEKPPASENEIATFYQENPALFADRRVYTVAEIFIASATDSAREIVTAHIASHNGIDQLAEKLKSAKIEIRFEKITRAAEMMPMDMLNLLHNMAIGRPYENKTTNVAAISVLAIESSESAPLSLPEVTDKIRHFLLSQRKNDLIATETTALRKRGEVLVTHLIDR